MSLSALARAVGHQLRALACVTTEPRSKARAERECRRMVEFARELDAWDRGEVADEDDARVRWSSRMRIAAEIDRRQHELDALRVELAEREMQESA